MKPYKLKEVLNKRALDKQENLDLILKLNSFHWNKFREFLSNTTEPFVDIKGLGVFYRKFPQTLDKIQNIETVLNKKHDITYREELLNTLNHLKVVYERLSLEKENVKNKKRLKNEFNSSLEK